MKRLIARFCPCLLLVFVGSVLVRGDVAGNAGLDAALPTGEGKRVLSQDGYTFELGSSARNEHVDTEEYFLPGESAAHWTQMVTCQRIHAAGLRDVTRCVTALRRQIEQGASRCSYRQVMQTSTAAVFGVEYMNAQQETEQLALVFVFEVPGRGRGAREVQVVQFAADPRALSQEVLGLQLNRWRARFQSQAATLQP